jgi:plasmid stabilization system protein ParE
MTLLLYAIADRPPVGELPPGVGGEAVWAISEGPTSALVSRHPEAPKFDESAAWAYERVIEAAMESAAVAPMRFGSFAADPQEVQQILRERCEELMDALHRIRGRVEVSVRATWPSADEPASRATTGRAYMEARLEPAQRARALRDRLREALDPLADASRYRLVAGAPAPLTAAFLVGRDAAGDFVARATRLAAEVGDAELSCTGPWPAYSFVSEDTA